MNLRARLAGPAARIERVADRLLRRSRAARSGAPEIEAYLGYSTPEGLVARGRVLSSVTRHDPRENQHWIINLRQMVLLFLTREVGAVTVRAVDFDVTAVSDDEGYFTLQLPPVMASGWVDVAVEAEGASATLPVQIAGPDAQRVVISDIDDTVIHTGAYSLWRNLRNSLTGNARTRRVFPDAVSLLTRLTAEGRDPLYFVSSSPWNLHGFLVDVFRRNSVPLGPMFLRDYGISETQFITGTHGDHKSAAVDVILGAHPELRAVLVGDTAQHDGAVYHAAAKRHPGRIEQVILRAPGRGADADDMAHVKAMRGLGVKVHVATDYLSFLES